MWSNEIINSQDQNILPIDGLNIFNDLDFSHNGVPAVTMIGLMNGISKYQVYVYLKKTSFYITTFIVYRIIYNDN